MESRFCGTCYWKHPDDAERGHYDGNHWSPYNVALNGDIHKKYFWPEKRFPLITMDWIAKLSIGVNTNLCRSLYFSSGRPVAVALGWC